ncbi:hypothetical protein GBAR_LOCUS29095, partial [Geodia barretti]
IAEPLVHELFLPSSSSPLYSSVSFLHLSSSQALNCSPDSSCIVLKVATTSVQRCLRGMVAWRLLDSPTPRPFF